MQQTEYETVVSRYIGKGVRIIELNRPECLNAMNHQLISDVARAFEDANAEADSRALVFTGAGKSFCAGDDRREHSHPETEAQAREVVDNIQQVTRTILQGPKPVVGAINGYAVGGGFEWALNCDFSIWNENSAAFFPEVSLNLFVTGAVTAILPALVGHTKAREMLMLGDRYSAQQLHQLGVAWRVAKDDCVLDEAIELARRLAALPELSLRTMRRVLNQVDAGIERALALETEATVQGFLDPLTTKLLKDF